LIIFQYKNCTRDFIEFKGLDPDTSEIDKQFLDEIMEQEKKEEENK